MPGAVNIQHLCVGGCAFFLYTTIVDWTINSYIQLLTRIWLLITSQQLGNILIPCITLKPIRSTIATHYNITVIAGKLSTVVIIQYCKALELAQKNLYYAVSRYSYINGLDCTIMFGNHTKDLARQQVWCHWYISLCHKVSPYK